MSDKIQLCFSKGQWAKARIIIADELRKDRDNHWLLTRLATTYYEENKYKISLKYCRRAYEIAPNCPLVLWDFACALDMEGKRMKAIRIWERLLKRGIQRVAYDECGEGIRWARSLLNDCNYRISLSYMQLKKYIPAKIYIKRYMNNRSKRVGSIYTVSETKQKMKELNALVRVARRYSPQ